MTGSTLESLVAELRDGGLVIHPTESVYGIGGSVEGPATARLRLAKGREAGGFVVLVPGGGEWTRGLLSPVGEALASRFWPGPLTMVVDDPDGRFPEGVKAPDGSVAVRVCGNPATAALLDAFSGPITSTSANTPGGRPARSFEEAREAAIALGLELKGLDGGPLEGGAPSTLVDARGDRLQILREGRILADEVYDAVGRKERVQ